MNARPRREPFEQIPKRLADAMETGELSDRQAALLLYIWLRLSHPGKRFVAKASALKTQRSEYPSARALRRDLDSLRAAGWLAYESRSGQRRPYEFRLGPRAIGRPGHDLVTTWSPSTPDSDRVSWSRPEPSDGANPLPERDTGQADLVISRARADEDEYKDVTPKPAASLHSPARMESTEEGADPPGLAEALARIEDAAGKPLIGAGRHAARIGWRVAPDRVDDLIDDALDRGRENPVGLLATMMICGDFARERVDHPPASDATERAEEEWEQYVEGGEWLDAGDGPRAALALLIAAVDAGERYGPVTAEGRDEIQRIAHRVVWYAEECR